MSNRLDKIISWFSPETAIKRARGRNILAYYEAGKKTGLQRQRRAIGGPNSAPLRSAVYIREQTRWLDSNLDLFRGALNTIIQNVVGKDGIVIEPHPIGKNGDIDDTLAETIDKEWQAFCDAPEVTASHNWAAVQRLSCRSWIRDGEVFSQRIAGNVPSLNHRKSVPFSIELIESDLVPHNALWPSGKSVSQGIEYNAWGAAIAYHVLKGHPGESLTTATKRIPAERIDHLKMVDRIRQSRGVSLFASIILRMDDIKDYEDSERIAARVAASMAGFIKKGSPDSYQEDIGEDGEVEERRMQFKSGMIFDDLRPGEEIGTIDSTRPNAQLEDFRNGQLRAAASPIYLTYSAFSKNYNGTYSAQRQELVEGYGAYGILASEFISKFIKPTYRDWLKTAVLSGRIKLPTGMDISMASNAIYIPPQMPWIDPVKEAKAWELLNANDFASKIDIIRRRGANPRDLLNQKKRWEKMTGVKDEK